MCIRSASRRAAARHSTSRPVAAALPFAVQVAAASARVAISEDALVKSSQNSNGCRSIAAYVGIWGAAVLLAGSSKAALDWGFTYWQAAFIDSLASRHTKVFWSLMVLVFAIMLVESALVAIGTIARARWALAIRSIAASRHAPMLSDAALVHSSTLASQHDLVQTVVDDTRTRAELSVALSGGLTASLTTALLFGATLALMLPVIRWHGVSIPAPMLALSIIWFSCSALLLRRVGRGLDEAESSLATGEGWIRASIARLRENARAVALLRGVRWEAVAFQSSVNGLQDAVRSIAKLRARLQAIGCLVGPSDLLVFLVLSPLYFDHQLSFGQLFQAGMAHRGIGIALDWFVNQYPDWVRLQAARSRLRAWERHVQLFRENSDVRCSIGGQCLEISALELWDPSGRRERWHRRYPYIRVDRGQHVLVRAPSGYGKSTLLAALAGAWPWGSGTLAIPSGAMFIPQRPYFPCATLLAAICYPEEVTDERRSRAVALMRSLALGELESHIGDDCDWNARLSGGEAARLALVRALISDPDWLFLDEPTANLDQDAADLYWAVLRRQAKLSVILISHREHSLGPDVVEIDLCRDQGKRLTIASAQAPAAASLAET